MRTIEIFSRIAVINILFLFLIQCQENNKVDYRVIKIKNGWGYELFSGDRILIHQEIIPVIEGNSPFLSRRDARNTGKLALYKVSTGKIPMITKRDLDSLGIAYP